MNELRGYSPRDKIELVSLSSACVGTKRDAMQVIENKEVMQAAFDLAGSEDKEERLIGLSFLSKISTDQENFRLLHKTHGQKCLETYGKLTQGADAESQRFFETWVQKVKDPQLTYTHVRMTESYQPEAIINLGQSCLVGGIKAQLKTPAHYGRGSTRPADNSQTQRLDAAGRPTHSR